MKKEHRNVKVYYMCSKNPIGHSKRAVKIRELSGTEVDEADMITTKGALSDDGKTYDQTKGMVDKLNMLSKLALVAVTKNPVAKKEDLVKLTEKDWKVFTDQEKELGWSALIDELLRPKDKEAIARLMQGEYLLNVEDTYEIINFPMPVASEEV